jgi:hypothetical protein
MHPFFTDIGSQLAVSQNVLNTAAASEIDGDALEINDANGAFEYQSGVIMLATGAATGSPSAVSVVATLQDSEDGLTGWATVDTLPQTPPQVTIGASAQASANVNLRGARQYIRLAVVPTFTGGTVPAIPISAVLVVGGSSSR